MDKTPCEESFFSDKSDYHFILLTLLHLLRRVESDDQIMRDLYREVYRRMDKVHHVELEK